MNIIPCYQCALRSAPNPKSSNPFSKIRCAILEEKLGHITAGSGITAIDFKCPTRDAIYKPGDAVYFKYWNHDGGESIWSRGLGYVWKIKERKVVVLSADTRIPILRFYTGQLRPAEGVAPALCCIHCGKPKGLLDAVYSRSAMESKPYVCRDDYSQPFDGEYPTGVEFNLPCEYPDGTKGPEPNKRPASASTIELEVF